MESDSLWQSPAPIHAKNIKTIQTSFEIEYSKPAGLRQTCESCNLFKELCNALRAECLQLAG